MQLNIITRLGDRWRTRPRGVAAFETATTEVYSQQRKIPATRDRQNPSTIYLITYDATRPRSSSRVVSGLNCEH
eukprot:scaffold46482_cov64-Phaeocystis_antarctica.AAC.1